jgi:hypothetical protein
LIKELYIPNFLRRRFRQNLREPTLNFAYRAGGFAILVAFSAGAVVAIYFPALVHASAPVMAVLAGFGAVLLLTGFASSEAWEWAMSRVNFQAYASPYGRRRLGVFTAVLSAAIVLVVYLLLL